MIQNGKLKAFAVTSKARHPSLPNVPTVAEAGLPGFELEAWVGLFAPAGTPPAVVQRLHEAFVTAIRSPDVSKKILDTGLDVTTSRSPEEFAALIAADAARLGKVVRDAGVKVD